MQRRRFERNTELFIFVSQKSFLILSFRVDTQDLCERFNDIRTFEIC